MISNIYKYLFFLNFILLFSQSQPSEIEILSIIIEGNNRFAEEDVNRHIKLSPGMKISGEDIQEIIKKMY